MEQERDDDKIGQEETSGDFTRLGRVGIVAE